MSNLEKRPLRVMIYDNSTLEDGWDGLAKDGLAMSWVWGERLYKTFGRIDIAKGVSSFDEAFEWLLSLEQPIAQIQFWCHGWCGKVALGNTVLDEVGLRTDRSYYGSLVQLKKKLTPTANVWFRTCGTFASDKGHEFATRFSEVINDPLSGRSVTGHTFLIAFFQGGLHTLRAGQKPHWSPFEGIKRGNNRNPKALRMSGFRSPNTITCLHNKHPESW